MELHDLGPRKEQDARRRPRGVRRDAVQELRLVGRAADWLRAVREGRRGQGALRPDAGPKRGLLERDGFRLRAERDGGQGKGAV